ncbi:HEPN domain-containing protein [Desulfitobacterium chlororespirans]|uniref:HEPN domain-containing protein n=1 Tax=Desulfitobacterium chlororespirans DSM 11544 TaxID=1121395 RepID=A0A1M7TP00_9FIRM|nr:HEPN domain-containing protein [Desulfitobacterium chlororespirans]SHN72435.1 HEPN domain-containing protein [Desulfitobacterium chlororespirans DSM 11544]
MMQTEDIINYWRDSSDKDYFTMMNLFKSKDYHWSLFLGHLVLEKLLKALFVKNIGEENVPRTHNLLLLANKARLSTDNAKEDLLDLITTFNISTRYPDYQHTFYKKCTDTYTEERIAEIKELRLWLISILESN